MICASARRIKALKRTVFHANGYRDGQSSTAPKPIHLASASTTKWVFPGILKFVRLHSYPRLSPFVNDAWDSYQANRDRAKEAVGLPGGNCSVWRSQRRSSPDVVADRRDACEDRRRNARQDRIRAIRTCNQQRHTQPLLDAPARRSRRRSARCGLPKNSTRSKTMALDPVAFLVTPKLLAMMVMMPCLTMWSDLMGVTGGALFGVTGAGFTFGSYFIATREALRCAISPPG